MNAIDLNLPQGCVVKGILLPQYPIEDLDQEILEVDLPDGSTIDVGWYPQFDRNGSFQIYVYRDYWENQEEAPVLASTPESVAHEIEVIARRRLNPRALARWNGSCREFHGSWPSNRKNDWQVVVPPMVKV